MNPNEIQTWVAVKQFQKNIYQYMDNLPIVITKHGKPFAAIIGVGNRSKNKVNDETNRKQDIRPKVAPIIAIRPIEEKLDEFQSEKGVEVCEHGRMKGLCEHGCK
jgi:antitoxin (DNA-binding transcriptional repressor) of toxin-antitoxin stability system